MSKQFTHYTEEEDQKLTKYVQANCIDKHLPISGAFREDSPIVAELQRPFRGLQQRAYEIRKRLLGKTDHSGNGRQATEIAPGVAAAEPLVYLEIVIWK